jgi:hypothetical protein
MTTEDVFVPHSGHFALETHGEEIASRIEDFLKQHNVAA